MRPLGYFFLLIGIACGSTDNGDDSASAEASFDEAMLGRWDVSVSGDDPYPLWFELERSGTGLGGRLQPRGGHALPFETLEAFGDTLAAQVAGASYEGLFDGERWRGSGRRDDSSFDWTAVRAPALEAPENPSWGEPLELFNGKDLDGWSPFGGQENQWATEDGVLVNEDSGANLVTDRAFQNFKLHIEVNVPEGSNSGIYLRGRHEIQVQDDHGKEPHARHMGGVYGQVTPTSNPSLPAGEWQSFDITLLGRWVTVVLNGETIIAHQEIPGITGGALDSHEGEPGPIYLQGDHGRVLYRNIVLTEAE